MEVTSSGGGGEEEREKLWEREVVMLLNTGVCGGEGSALPLLRK